MRFEKFAESRHQRRLGPPPATRNSRGVVLGLAGKQRARQAIGLLLVGLLVAIGAGILAADRRPSTGRLVGARQFEKNMPPGMSKIEFGRRNPVIGEIEEAGIGASGA